MIYTTIESLNSRIKKVTNNRKEYNNEEWLFKMIYLIVEDVSKRWTKKMDNWAEILSELSGWYGERIMNWL